VLHPNATKRRSNTPSNRDGWVYEIDGWRMLAYDGRAVRRESRGGEVLDLLEHHMARQPSVPPVAGCRHVRLDLRCRS
jgi:hypothetical protein